MTPLQAHEILDLWKAGAKHYPTAVITAALLATGDIERATCKAHPNHA